MSELPIDSLLPQLLQRLEDNSNIVLQAAPGAGKTTRVPLALLDQAWLGGQRIIMLEPRRLAARNAATYMAKLLGERVGETVGYRTRLDSKVGSNTRIEVVTEGILTRLLQNDPSLEPYGLVIFDEFHERSLQADLGLTLCLDVQEGLRDELKILVMSATLDTLAVAHLLGDAPTLVSEGRSFPVDIIYTRRPDKRQLSDAVVATVLRALNEETGDALVFLPGVREIKAVQRLLKEAQLGSNTLILPLYGDLSNEAQQRAIVPSPDGLRKIVLATAIAETSLTIEGVRIVVDAGLRRVPRFYPRSGMERLETLSITKAGAEQRCGRAGRLESGVCYRLWSDGDQRSLLAHAEPVILEADLAPLVLELAQWGITDPTQLKWLNPPPEGAFQQARNLLIQLGAIGERGQVTAHGKQMTVLGMHPRLAHMVLTGKAMDIGGLACDVAAVLSERDFIKSREADLRLRLESLHQPGRDPQVDVGACRRVASAARHLKKRLRISHQTASVDQAGLLLALAYPDRIAQCRTAAHARFRLANGRGGIVNENDSLAAEPYLAVAQLGGGERHAYISLAAPISLNELEQACQGRISTQPVISWDDKTGAVQSCDQRTLGYLVLGETALASPDPQQMCSAMLIGVRQRGLEVLPWGKELRTWRSRVALLHRLQGSLNSRLDWPDVSDEALLAQLERWLGPYLNGISRLTHLARLNLKEILQTMLGWERQQALDKLAPTHLKVPSGSSIAIDYSGESPVLAVRLQELFGLTTTPQIAGGKLAVTLHLLSPARRPIQVTQDLASFWENTYHEVKKELKGRYPKHYWPDDPLQAMPTKRVKPRK